MSHVQVNNTVIDWFEPWPEQALQSVASVFLADEVLPEDLRPQIVEHMITVHQSVRTFSVRFQVSHASVRVWVWVWVCFLVGPHYKDGWPPLVFWAVGRQTVIVRAAIACRSRGGQDSGVALAQ